MPRFVKPAISTILVVAVILSVAGWWTHDWLSEKKADRARERHRAERTQKAKEMVAEAVERRGAIANWNQKLPSLPSAPLSVEVEEAVVRNDGKPILVDGLLEDIARRDNRFYLYVDDIDSSIHFILECDTDTVRHLREHRDSYYQISVIAQVNSVGKAELELKSGAKTTEDDAPVEIDWSSLFLARGKCVEVVFSDD